MRDSTTTCSTHVRARVHNASRNVNFDLIPRAFRYHDGVRLKLGERKVRIDRLKVTAYIELLELVATWEKQAMRVQLGQKGQGVHVPFTQNRIRVTGQQYQRKGLRMPTALETLVLPMGG